MCATDPNNKRKKMDTATSTTTVPEEAVAAPVVAEAVPVEEAIKEEDAVA